MFSRFDTIPTCDRRTNILPRHSPRSRKASRGKNINIVFSVGYTMDTLYFSWLETPVDIDAGLRLPQFTLQEAILYDCSQNYTAGSLPLTCRHSGCCHIQCGNYPKRTRGSEARRRRRRDRDAEGVERERDDVSLPSRLGGLGSVVSSRSGVRGRAQARF